MSDRRPETGALKFGDDWTGVFIRGDDAIGLAHYIQVLLAEKPSGEETLDVILARSGLQRLAKILESSFEETDGEVQRMKNFSDATNR